MQGFFALLSVPSGGRAPGGAGGGGNIPMTM